MSADITCQRSLDRPCGGRFGLLVAAGAGATYVSLRSTRQATPVADDRERTPNSRPASAPPGREAAADPMTSAPLPDVVVPLSTEAAERAGITVDRRDSWSGIRGLAAPGRRRAERVQARRRDAARRRPDHPA